MSQDKQTKHFQNYLGQMADSIRDYRQGRAGSEMEKLSSLREKIYDRLEKKFYEFILKQSQLALLHPQHPLKQCDERLDLLFWAGKNPEIVTATGKAVAQEFIQKNSEFFNSAHLVERQDGEFPWFGVGLSFYFQYERKHLENFIDRGQALYERDSLMAGADAGEDGKRCAKTTNRL